MIAQGVKGRDLPPTPLACESALSPVSDESQNANLVFRNIKHGHKSTGSSNYRAESDPKPTKSRA